MPTDRRWIYGFAYLCSERTKRSAPLVSGSERLQFRDELSEFAVEPLRLFPER